MGEQVAPDHKADVARVDQPKETGAQSPSLDMLVQRAASAYRQGRANTAAFSPAALLALQRTAGNRAVNALLSRASGNQVSPSVGIGQLGPEGSIAPPSSDEAVEQDKPAVDVHLSAEASSQTESVAARTGQEPHRVRPFSVQRFKSDHADQEETSEEDEAKPEAAAPETGQVAPPADAAGGAPPNGVGGDGKDGAGEGVLGAMAGLLTLPGFGSGGDSDQKADETGSEHQQEDGEEGADGSGGNEQEAEHGDGGAPADDGKGGATEGNADGGGADEGAATPTEIEGEKGALDGSPGGGAAEGAAAQAGEAAEGAGAGSSGGGAHGPEAAGGAAGAAALAGGAAGAGSAAIAHTAEGKSSAGAAGGGGSAGAAAAAGGASAGSKSAGAGAGVAGGGPAAAAAATGGGAAALGTQPGGAAAGPGVAGGAGGGSARLHQVIGQVHQAAHTAQGHPGAGGMVGAAQAATPAPANETAGTAQALQSGAMHAAQPGKPNKESFLALLRSKLEAIAPKSNQDLKDFKKSGKADQLRGELGQGVKTQNQAAQSQIAGATNAAPPTDQVQPRQIGPAPAPPTPPVVPPIDGAQAAPPPAPDPSPALAQQNQAAEQQMASHKITPQQLQKAKDPRFTAVLDARDQMHTNAAEGPAKAGEDQKAIIAATQNDAQGAAAATHADLLDAHTRAHAGAHGKQQAVMSKDEAARKKVADDIQAKYQATKTAVEAKLKELDEPIDKMFDEGEQAARAQFEQNIDHRTTMEMLENPLMAAVGWLTGWDPVMRAIWDDEHTRYMSAMDTLLVQIADKVEQGLADAKKIIDDGHADIEKYVAGLAPSLRQSGEQAEQEVNNEFQELEHTVEAKRDALASHLAERYQKAQKDIDDRMKELEESHRGLVGAFLDKVEAVAAAIAAFKAKLAGIAQNAEETLDLIMDDPIAFLNHLLDALKKGFGKFLDNIMTHLKKGLIGWLTGALSSSGITLPDTFDLKGIGMLVLQLLGITWEKIEAKLTKIIGPRGMTVVKKIIDYVKTLMGGGVEALWEKIKADLSGLKDMVINAIESWLVETVIKIAMEKLVMLSNPAGEIIEAVMDIYKTVMFFIEKAQQITALVDTIVNSIHKIATGAIDDAANWIEKTMGDTIPVIISFLADLLGLSGIADTVTDLIKKLQGMVDQAIDAALEKIVAVAKGMFGGDDKDAKDGKKGPDERTDDQKQHDFDEGMGKAEGLLGNENLTMDQVKEKLPEIKDQYKFTALDVVIEKEEEDDVLAHIEGSMSPPRSGPTVKKKKDHDKYKPTLKLLRLNNDGLAEFSYSYENAQFVATVNADGTTRSVEGTGLQIKKPGLPRGVTQSPDVGGAKTHVANMVLNRAHLIADEFMGSGYGKSYNVITTSDSFNKQTMRDAELSIGQWMYSFEENEADAGNDMTFNLKVKVEWGKFITDSVIEQIFKSDPKKWAEPEKVEEILKKWAKDHADACGIRLKRCMNVRYEWIVECGDKKKSGGPLDTGPDLGIGMG